MIDRGEIIRVLKKIAEDKRMLNNHDYWALICAEAAKLLKSQQPVEPMLKREGWNKYHNWYVCPVCGQELVYEQNYCSECGKAVKWDAAD